MAEYIDRDGLINDLKDLPEQERIEYMGIYDCIKSTTAADVVEVVRCKDCLYATERYGHLTCINGISYCNHWNRPDDFCNYGVRRYGDTK